MASVRHAFDSSKADPVDATKIGATKWGLGHEFEGLATVTNVMDAAYGGVGDGIADDSAAVRAAIEATGWPANAGMVHFPVRPYKLDSGVTLDGDGASSTPELHLVSDGATILTTTPGITMFDVTNPIVSLTRVKFRGLYFNINAAAIGVLLNNAELCEFIGCGFGGSFSTGIKITGTSTYNRISSCEFTNMARGIHLNGGANYLQVHNNTFGEALSGSPLNWIESDSGSNPATGVEVIGNTFYSPGATLPTLRIKNGSSWVVSGNHFTRSTLEALWIGTDGSSSMHSIVGNTFSQGNRHDIFINGGRENSIVGNTFGQRDTLIGTVPDNTYANVRIANTFGGAAGSDNIVIGNRSRDTAAAITYIIEADANCQNLTIIGNSGLAGISAPHASNLIIRTGADRAVLATGASHTADDIIAALQAIGFFRQS